MALLLCAAIHGLPADTHGPVSVPAASSAMVAGGEPHEPHGPHQAEDCAADVIIRKGAHSVEGLPLPATVLVVLVVVSVVLGRPCVRQGSRRRRGARTGRVTLVVTSRWRI
jgi:hypothetical protein